MLLVADIHGNFEDLARVATTTQPLLVLGDLLNFVDYRTHEGMLAEVAGRDFVARLAEVRSRGDKGSTRELWRSFSSGREEEIRSRYDKLIQDAYEQMADALAGATAFVTYGNVDRPDVLRAKLPDGARFVDGEVVEIEGWRVGFAGGGVPSIGVPGEVAEDAMAAKLEQLGPVDILCTHVAPAIPQLSHDVVGGRPKQSRAVLDFVRRRQPRFHYFGDIHQPQAIIWRVGETRCRNVGYFRATGRAVHHPARNG